MQKSNPEGYWLNLYTMLSRCTRLRDILLTHPIDREVFERGPPKCVRREMQRLHKQAVTTAKRTEQLRRQLEWPPYAPVTTEQQVYNGINDEDRED